uniref:NB-ARC domain-containing protein n=1 Tax=Solanum tuberosum TaxID=4113 RepID=M1AXG5_SOLTU
MDMLSSVVSGFIVEVGKYMCKCIYPKIENIVCISSKIENLREEMKNLTKFRDDINAKVDEAEGEGYKPKLDVVKWIEDVREVCIIGMWGTGGVGKTTLVSNLNNELLKTDVLGPKLSFGVVVWVTVPKPPIDVRNVQAQIASRLNLKVDNEGSVKSIASKIYQRLEQEKSFLLILDDVWEPTNLDDVGVPQPEDPARSKVIITSRSLDVCKQMKTDTEMKVYTLDADESWQLFVKNAGDSANLEHIQSFAKDIVRECGGLPLAITVIGTSMRGKNRVELWEDALKSLRISTPHNKEVEKKVYNVIKWSFDSVESQDDIELSSEHENKKRGDIRSCFLYCSLYPAAMSTNDLIHCWWAEGFLGEHDTYEETYNRGITMIESLKDACLLEADKVDYVKMHDVVRDVAKWIDESISHDEVPASAKRLSFISNKIEHLTECLETTTLLLQDNYSLREIPHEFFLLFPALRVVSLSHTGITTLPCSINSLCQLRALILHHCTFLEELPPIGNLCNLQLLDCDNTRFRCLPQGMDKLINLRLLDVLVCNFEENIGEGLILKLPRIEMLNIRRDRHRLTSFDEISSLHNLTCLYINFDSSSILNISASLQYII